jgi:xanthine dehydrogenase large subunit
MNKPVEPLLPEATLARAATITAGAAGQAVPHESARLHVAGAAPYTDDLPEAVGTLHAALGLSPVARGRITAMHLDRIRALPGVVAVFAADDVPGGNAYGPILQDEPILAGAVGGELAWLGQPVFAVVATTRDAARRAAARAKDAIEVEPLPALLTPEAAHAAGAYVVPPLHLARSQAVDDAAPRADREAAVRAALTRAPHRLREVFTVGGQEQFYLEGQISVATPREDRGLHLLCSTQHPTEMQHLVAHALGVPSSHVQVECRRMGGGFGGKESQSAVFALVAAVAAQALQRPVKLRVDRDDDFLVTGRRHGFRFELDIGYDDEGRILAAEVAMVSRAGASADLSPPVMTRALCHFDNAYWLPEVALHGYCARTNTQSNTAFRGFGGPQGALAIEWVIDTIARRLGRDPLAVRRLNFYGGEPGPRTPDNGAGRVTPYTQRVEDNILRPLVDRLEATSDYTRRRSAIAAFNAASPVLKKGLALTPVKFGISFNVRHFNQAGALVHVYTDGSVLVNHGGTEMGQGLNTKVAQVVAHTLGVPLSTVRVSATDTAKVANTSATAASTGSDLNGKAAEDAARQIRERLAAHAAATFGDADTPASAVHFEDGHVTIDRPGGRRTVTFAELALSAYLARVQLWSDGFYATPKLHWNRDTLQGRPFFYFAYGAAVSEVLVDTLTGEFRLLRADVLHDVGRSLNPALDIGQIEGAFIQGMGWLTMEELVWHPTTGLLLTHAPSTYKIPTANDCPPDFRVALWDGENAEDTIHRSKAVGEPPLLLPFSVFFAIRDAVSAVGGHRVDPPLSAPATPEAVLRAVDAVREAVRTGRPPEPAPSSA